MWMTHKEDRYMKFRSGGLHHAADRHRFGGIHKVGITKIAKKGCPHSWLLLLGVCP